MNSPLVAITLIMINFNMGCIEIRKTSVYAKMRHLINFNMGCIEIQTPVKYQLHHKD